MAELVLVTVTVLADDRLGRVWDTLVDSGLFIHVSAVDLIEDCMLVLFEVLWGVELYLLDEQVVAEVK
jgi:hypothetical protein